MNDTDVNAATLRGRLSFLLFFSVPLKSCTKYKMQKTCRGTTLQLDRYASKVTKGSPPSAGSSRVSSDSFIGSNSACGALGTNEERDGDGFAVITGPVKEWQPLGEVAMTMKATHSDSHSRVFGLSTPVTSSAQPLQSDMQYLFTYQNAKSAANREVNMEIITIRVSTNTASEQSSTLTPGYYTQQSDCHSAFVAGAFYRHVH